MKPSHTPERTGIFFIAFASENEVATVSLEVFSATTISSNFIMFAGEKKCNPITLSGFETTSAISFTFALNVPLHVADDLVVVLAM